MIVKKLPQECHRSFRKRKTATATDRITPCKEVYLYFSFKFRSCQDLLSAHIGLDLSKTKYLTQALNPK